MASSGIQQKQVRTQNANGQVFAVNHDKNQQNPPPSPITANNPDLLTATLNKVRSTPEHLEIRSRKVCGIYRKDGKKRKIPRNRPQADNSRPGPHAPKHQPQTIPHTHARSSAGTSIQPRNASSSAFRPLTTTTTSPSPASDNPPRSKLATPIAPDGSVFNP